MRDTKNQVNHLISTCYEHIFSIYKNNLLKFAEIPFNLFSLVFTRTPPALAQAGGLVCRKIKLKFFSDPKRAGGCGVVPFPSATRLFCLYAAAPAGRGEAGALMVLRWGTWS